MYEKFFEQAQSAFKPVSELLTLNAKILEEATEKQTVFLKDFVNDSVSFAKELGEQKDYSGIYQAQKSYIENIQSKWIAASTDAYQAFTSNQERLSEVFKRSASPR